MAYGGECFKRFLWLCPVVRLMMLVSFFGTAAWGCRNESRPAHDSELETTTHVAVPRSPGSLPRLLDLGADACIPCKKMVPVLDELEKEYQGRLEVQFLDVFKYPKLADEYGVRTVPAQIFYGPSGKEVYRHEGFIAKADILKKWKELGVDLTGGAAGR